MADVYKRRKTDKYWQARILGRRVSTHCKDKRAAEIRAAELEREAADPLRAAAAKATLADAIEALRLELIARGRSLVTVERSRQKLGHFVRLWGEGFLLRGLTPELVAAYIEQRRADGVSGTTVRDELAFLRQMAKVARRAKLWSGEASDIMPLRFEAGHRPVSRFLTQEQASELLRHLKPERAAFVAFILATGARLGEAYRARREDVGAELVRLRGTKTEGADSSVPVVAMMRPWLDFAMGIIHRDTKPENVVFAHWHKLHRDMRAASVRAGVPYTTPNDWRRSMAHWLGDAGATPTHVAGMLRHSTDTLAQTTYNRTTGERLATSMRGVSDLHRDNAAEREKLLQLDFVNPHLEGAKRRKWRQMKVPPVEIESTAVALGKRWTEILLDGESSQIVREEWGYVSELNQLEAMVGGME